METGEMWAYRARATDPLVQIEVIKQGVRKPPRVLIRFVAPDFEGLEEWVPLGRLKVPWSAAPAFAAGEHRWDAIHGESASNDSPEVNAADVVFARVIDRALATLEASRRSPYVSVIDLPGLARALGLEEATLKSHPASFVENGRLIAPWPTALLIARRGAALSPEPILDYVDAEEGKAQYEAIHGHEVVWGRGRNSSYTTPERCLEWDNEEQRPVRQLLRQWCGQDAVDMRQELIALRLEIRRVGKVADEAISQLRQAGREREANRLSRDLETSTFPATRLASPGP